MRVIATIVCALLWMHISGGELKNFPPFAYTSKVESTPKPEAKKLLFKSKKDSAIYNTAVELNIPVDHFKTLIWIECRGNFKAKNKYTKAAGCIQFMPNTLKRWGITTEELLELKDYEQMQYVKKYFKNYRGSCLSDLYFHVFFPIAKGKPDNWVLKARGIPATEVARYNKPFDLNNNDSITVGEIKTYLSDIKHKL